MKIGTIEHIDDFGLNEHVCWCEVEDVPSEFIAQAKAIDGENFLESCFGICVGCDEDDWYVCQDNFYCELYYVDNNGEKHWMEYLLSDEQRQASIGFCKSYIEEEC